MRLADESACPTTGKSFACIGGACFSLPTPACGRISSQHLREGLPASLSPATYTEGRHMRFPRSSGILLHPTSLPGPYGIGDLGESARRFADFLAIPARLCGRYCRSGPPATAILL